MGALPPIPGGFTAVPNVLIDQVMPSLRDTEWRLLVVIVRQTYGRSSPTGRRERDWLTHGQLKARTGRASEAVSGALDTLVRRGLVEVSGEDGVPVISPAGRRRFRSRLYYRLSPRVGLLSLATKARIPTSETEDRKPKTTEETGTKGIPYGISPSDPSTSAIEPAPATGIRRFLDAYAALFRDHSLRGEPPPISWGKDSRLVRDLVDLYGLDRLLELLSEFFQSQDAWIRESGYSLGAFRAALPRLLTGGPCPPKQGMDSRQPFSRSAGWQRASHARPT